MEILSMNYLIILNSPHEFHFDEVHKIIQDYDASKRINTSTWLVNTAYEAKIIRQHLLNILGIHDSLLVFKIDREHSFANELDLNEWMEEMNKKVSTSYLNPKITDTELS